MKEMRNKKEKGITLIALVVTIAVLIILATVSINAVLGQNGIIKKSKDMSEMYEKSKENEEIAMKELANEVAKDTYEYKEPAPAKAGQIVKKPSNWTNENVIPISDGKGGTVPLPNNFYYVGGDYDTGLVISDKSGDTMDSSGVNMGNQFVWIPVTSEATLTRTLFNLETGEETAGISTTEPYADGYATEESEYNTMRSQVLKYGGFYIGRFEAGVNSTTLRTASTGNQTVVCKKGVAPYNYVSWGKAMNDMNTAFSPTDPNTEVPLSATNYATLPVQNGCAYLAKNMYSSSNSITSTLVYGCEWDAMCRYIGDCQRTSKAKSAADLTGSVSTDVSKNIYDLAGNCQEITMESGGSGNRACRILRGGSYNNIYPVCARGYGFLPYMASGDIFAFRPALYIK